MISINFELILVLHEYKNYRISFHKNDRSKLFYFDDVKNQRCDFRTQVNSNFQWQQQQQKKGYSLFSFLEMFFNFFFSLLHCIYRRNRECNLLNFENDNRMFFHFLDQGNRVRNVIKMLSSTMFGMVKKKFGKLEIGQIFFSPIGFLVEINSSISYIKWNIYAC